MRARQLTIKTKQYYHRMRNVQKRFSRYIHNTRYKTEILRHFFSEYKETMRMQAINDKDQALIDKINCITEESMNQVIKRYVVFCKEQAQAIFHAYRDKVKNLSPAEQKGLKLRQTYAVQEQIKLYDWTLDQYNYDKDTLGGYV